MLLTEIGQGLNLGTRGLSALVKVLIALKFLEKSSDNYFYLSDLSSKYLLSSAPNTWKSMLLSHEDENCTRLKECLVRDFNQKDTNDKETKSWNSGKVDFEDAKKYSASMHSHSLSAAKHFAGNFDISKEFKVSSFLDIGGGSGCFAIELARKQPNIKCAIFELPDVDKVASMYVQSSGSDIDVLSGNMFSMLPAGFDGMFLCNILHDWSMKKCEIICRNVYESLEKDGTILIHEALLNENDDGPLLTSLFSMHMFVHTEGKQFKFSELNSLLSGIGFVDVSLRPSYGMYSLIVGKK